MLTPNASCTLYLQQAPSVYARRFVAACFWQQAEDGTLYICIPQQAPPLQAVYNSQGKERDYIVLGACELEVTDTATLRALLQTGRAKTIETFCFFEYGSLPHYEVMTQ